MPGSRSQERLSLETIKSFKALDDHFRKSCTEYFLKRRKKFERAAQYCSLPEAESRNHWENIHKNNPKYSIHLNWSTSKETFDGVHKEAKKAKNYVFLKRSWWKPLKSWLILQKCMFKLEKFSSKAEFSLIIFEESRKGFAENSWQIFQKHNLEFFVCQKSSGFTWKVLKQRKCWKLFVILFIKL